MDTSAQAEQQDRFKADRFALIPRMRAFAAELCGNRTDADELIQIALSKARAAWSHFEPGANLKAWLFEILRNSCFNASKRASRVVSLDPPVAERALAQVENPIARLELHRLRLALARLSEDQREALIMEQASKIMR